MRIVLACLLIVACEATGSLWDYKAVDSTCTANQRCGPLYWKNGAAYSACGSTDGQSPINAGFEAAPQEVGSALTDLVVPASSACQTATFLVNQHTAEVEFEEACTGSVTFKSVTYKLAQFHYHSPSEHTVDGAYYPMEVHHVHKSPTLANPTAYLVIGVFMTVDPAITATSCAVASVACSRAAFFDKVLTLGKGSQATALADVAAAANTEVHVEQVDVAKATVANDPYANFIPPMSPYFYHYTGSFTTPPCTGGVQWILNPTPVAVFDTSVTAYRKLINALKSNQLSVPAAPTWTWAATATWDATLGNNNRPIQLVGATNKLGYIGTKPTTTIAVSTTVTPWDSSASSSGPSDSLGSSISSSESAESDSSGSYGSSGSAASGSSGFYMAIWKWLILGLLLICCLAAIAALCCKPKPKPKKKKPVPAPTPAPEPEVEPLMPLTPLIPMQTTAIPTTSYPYAPVSTGYPPMTTAYPAGGMV